MPGSRLGGRRPKIRTYEILGKPTTALCAVPFLTPSSVWICAHDRPEGRREAVCELSTITSGRQSGFNGYFYQQTTNDDLKGVVFQDGFRGRDLAVGPQLRFPLGKHGGFAFKYYRDTLVQNKPRGNAFWFQLSVTIGRRAPWICPVPDFYWYQ